MTRESDEKAAKQGTEAAGAGEGSGAEAGREEADGKGKKERVLHTRVPAVLERELKRFADNLRIPVSNLVRAILEDAISAADAAGESVEGRLKLAAQQLEKEREKLKKRVMPDHLAQVYAYQPVTLAQPATCARCGKELRRGERAHLGLTEAPPSTPGDRLFLCDACLAAH